MKLHRTRRGIVTLVVLLLIPLIGVVMLVESRSVLADQRRTAAEIEDAQVRLLLFAAERAGRERIARGEVGSTDLPLPDALEFISVRIDTTATTATVTVQLDGRTWRQTTNYSRDGATLSLDGVTLESLAD